MRKIKEIQLQNEVFEIEDLYARNQIVETNNALQNFKNETANNFVNVHNIIDNLPITGALSTRRYAVVDYTGNGDFTTINAAWNYARAQYRDALNHFTIFLMPGVYHEQLVSRFDDYIDLIGINKYTCIIEYPSAYPNCVMRVEGNNLIQNITIRSTSTASYCLHVDLVDGRRAYDLYVDNCILYGGSNAIGHGATEGSHLHVTNCHLSGSQPPFYAHNSAYSNSPNQFITLVNNVIDSVNGIAVLLDDAGSDFGATNTILLINAVGNMTNVITAQVLFRPHPSAEQYNRHWIGDDTQVKLTTASSGNFNEALDYGGGFYLLASYITLPANPDPNGYYRTGINVGQIYATKYNRNLANVTLPGVGDVTSSFGLGAVTDHSIEISTTNSAYAGKTVSINLILTIA